MARLEVMTFPDEVLRTDCAPVEDFGDELKKLVMDMAETMYAYDGIGLAAPQVGIARRLIVLDVAPVEERGKSILALANPEIVEADGEIEWDEGCLSLPEVTVRMTRNSRVRVRGQDLEGEEVEFEADELFAVALQHEIDHLDGRLLIDYVPPLRRKILVRELKKRKQEDQEEEQDSV